MRTVVFGATGRTGIPLDCLEGEEYVREMPNVGPA